MESKPPPASPGEQITLCMCQTTPQALGDASWREFIPHGNKPEKDICPSLIQFIPVSPNSTFARHLAGHDQQFTWCYFPSGTGRDFLSWAAEAAALGLGLHQRLFMGSILGVQGLQQHVNMARDLCLAGNHGTWE